MIDAAGTLKRTSISVGCSKVGKNTNGKAIPRKSSMHQRLFGGNTNSKVIFFKTIKGKYF